MKLIVVILSVYFLALNAIPCNDTNEFDETSSAVTLSDNTNDHGHESGDFCSPFCQCHCCHTHIVDLELVSFEPLKPIVPQMSFTHFDSIGKDIHRSLLQPPWV